MEETERTLHFLWNFGKVVEEVFEAYDDMCGSDRRELVERLSRGRYAEALELVYDHDSFKKASEDVHFERTPIVDEETGRSFVTVEGGADPDLQHHFRNMKAESRLELKNADFSAEQILENDDMEKEDSNR